MSVIKNFKEMMGLSSIDEEFEEDEMLERVEEKQEEGRKFMPLFSKKNKEEVFEEEEIEEVDDDDCSTVFIDPKQFDDCKKIARYIRSGKMITINLESINPNIAQRIMDFLAGAMEIKNASFAQIAKNVYTIVPENMKVMYEGKKREKKLINLERGEN